MLPVPQDRTSGRRSSSIGCRSIVGRRTSTYITPSASCDPFKVCLAFSENLLLMLKMKWKKNTKNVQISNFKQQLHKRLTFNNVNDTQLNPGILKSNLFLMLSVSDTVRSITFYLMERTEHGNYQLNWFHMKNYKKLVPVQCSVEWNQNIITLSSMWFFAFSKYRLLIECGTCIVLRLIPNWIAYG